MPTTSLPPKPMEVLFSQLSFKSCMIGWLSKTTTGQVRISTNYSSLSNQFLERIMREIAKIVVRLDGFIQQIVPLGLHNVESQVQSCRLPTTSLVDETTVYGRDNDKEKIIQILFSNDLDGHNVTIVPIVGLGRIGKTTLAQLVYNDVRIKNHFSTTKAWVCISEDYDANRITKELNISFSVSESLNSLQVKLQLGLTDKKFLLVLDDVWNRHYDDWDKLKMLFKGGSKGSKIIVTTRDERIALIMGQKRSIHHLSLISEQDCWSLFEKHAFGDGDNENRSELEVIGKKIVNKCEGLPLAVKTIAGILCSTRMVKDWEDILRNAVWNKTENPNDILPALKLSYIHLPSQLKKCFAYCGMFHKDFWFEKKQIIQLWHANGLLEHSDYKRIERIGKEYLSELRLRSLLQQSADNHFFMHDLINDLAKSDFGKFVSCWKIMNWGILQCLKYVTSHTIPVNLIHLINLNS
ncbi:hypothetical protein ACH5RR_028764 [Cinchona calisaya]|uniref:NB-ARC domain-containing protein n=1 Tax=Cinchona calisaya TaxID=153742 RepID=A0ABD2YQZ0_9GENT